MAKADSVHSTPPTNTSATNPPGPVDTTRRRFLTVAAGASVASVGTLAVAAIAPGAPPAALARWPEVDGALMHASCDLTVVDLAITGLYSKYGADADGRDDYLAIEQQRDENIEILSTVPAKSWDGIWAKAAALRSRRTIEDERALAIAASLADDIIALGNLPVTS
jgi:hypothetical protein